MPFKPEDLILPGAGLVSDVANWGLQEATNKRNRKFTREMYWRQREDALNDWHMQNAYNAPDAQMARLKAAGLNPNLVYGHGAEGNSGSMPRGSSSSGGAAQSARVGNMQAGVMGMYDMRLRNAQADLTRENIELTKMRMVTEAERVKKMQADTLKVIQDTTTGREALNWISSQRPVMEALNLKQLEKLSADVEFTLDSNERQAALNAVTVRKAAEEILSIRLGRAKTQEEINHIKQQVENLKSSKVLQDLEAQWMREGRTKGDWYFWRFLDEALGVDPKDVNKKIRGKVLQNWGDPE